MTISEDTERIEKQILSPHAQLAADSKGRDRAEEPDPLRTCFQRDRDRIVHSKAFRRLKHKTQVFFYPEGDHFRVRMTHTLETSQVARTIARALRLNEDLTEAVALGHDLGHTPFGHVGEAVLGRLLDRPFRHAEQSVRIVETLEPKPGEDPPPGERGLNLTWEVRDGLRGHTWSQPEPATLEARIVRYADRIAYLNHDLDDAVRAGLIEDRDVPSGVVAVLGATHAERVNALVHAVVDSSLGKPDITMRAEQLDAMLELRTFMFERVYEAEFAHQGRISAERVIEDLFAWYLKRPAAMPQEYQGSPGDHPTRVADFVSGMTDRYALARHAEISGA